MNLATPLIGAAVLIGFGLIGGMDYQQQAELDQHYCQMADLQKRYIREHPMEIGRQAALSRPGWPVHRSDIDCRDYGFSETYNLSNP